VNEGIIGMSIEKMSWMFAGSAALSIATVTDWSIGLPALGSGHPPPLTEMPPNPAGSAPAEAPTTALVTCVVSPPTAATRAPSRVAARRLCSCQKASPYSIMPNTSIARSPTTRANSTAAAPSSRAAPRRNFDRIFTRSSMGQGHLSRPPVPRSFGLAIASRTSERPAEPAARRHR
jgi:hypothetical protein